MDINLQSIFTYLDEKFAEVDAQFKEIKETLNVHSTALTNLSHLTKTIHEELTVNHKKIQRLEEWAKLVADKVGIPIPF